MTTFLTILEALNLVVLVALLLSVNKISNKICGSSSLLPEEETTDKLYDTAKELVIEHGKASTSFIQRCLGIGYSRAAMIMDMLEDNGVIGPSEGSKPRAVLVQSKT